MKTKIGLPLAVAISALLGGQMATGQTVTHTNQATGADGLYVDPALKDRKRCRERPGRPEWMMEQPLEYQWRVEIASEYRSFYRATVIPAANDCSCETMYPDWNDHREEVEKIWSSVGETSRWEWDEATRDRFNEVRENLSDFSRPRLMDVVQLCEKLE